MSEAQRPTAAKDGDGDSLVSGSLVRAGGEPTSQIAVTNVRAVLPDRVLDDATIVIEHGYMVSVIERGAAPAHAIDGRGSFCIPGLVDTHSDGLERELQPRPGVDIPIGLAIRSYEGRVRAAGITTMYHGVGFQEGRKQRTIALANTLCEGIERRAASFESMIDHFILYRLEGRSGVGFDALRAQLPRRRVDGMVPLVSFEDHTPGQGQYADRTAYERFVAGAEGLSDEAAKEYVDNLIAERNELIANRDRALPWLTAEAANDSIRLLAHDLASADEVAVARQWHATVAEFPTTVEAAEAARRAGFRTVGGAPNVLRGGSHTGNVSAAELIARGLCDGLSSDYFPAALLGAVGALADDGVCSLRRAVALVTSGPADTVGLHDRGRLEPGQRGDLVIVSFTGRLPTVRQVIRAADIRFDASTEPEPFDVDDVAADHDDQLEEVSAP